MIIGIEAERANAAKKTGVEHYAKQLILHLAELDKKNKYILYLRSKPEEWFLSLPENFTVKVMPWPLFWTQLRIGMEMLVHPPDVLFIPASALPLLHPKKSVVTMHDLAWLKFPSHETWSNRAFLKFSSWFAAKAAWKLISVSASTKADLVALYGLNPEKISVVHHGWSVFPAAAGTAEALPDLPEKFVLFLSTLQPRKNLQGLITAFRSLRKRHPDLPHRLVVVGKPGWKYEPILEDIERNKDIVLYLNHVPEQEKALLLSRADALALPSFYEGFGMQILEAFAAGVPVVTSNVSSMPEVAGDAALYFDPADPEDMARALERVLLEGGLAGRLRERGKARLAEFSWDRCARETLAVFES